MPRVRHHVNPFRSQYRATGARVDLPDGVEVEVELGCADARFLFDRAAAHPDVHCVGLEIRRDLVDDVNLRAREAGLPNLEAVFTNINTELEQLFPDGRIARAYINFPDPWFKRRHHKRRLVTPELAELLHRKIAPGGQLFFQSDVWDLTLDALAVLEEQPGWANVRGPWSFHRGNPFGARSLREVRCEFKELPIWRILYANRAG